MTPEAQTGRGGGGGLGLLVGVALIALAAFVAGLLARDALLAGSAPPRADEAEAERARLERLADELQALNEKLDALALLPEQVQQLQTELAAVNARLEELVAASSTRAQRVQREEGPVEVSADDDPALGPEDAPVVIIEFSDFQCPFCKRFHASTLPQIIEEYVKPGKVRFVYRDFPLTRIHPNAGLAALAAECADEQGRFWPYHDRLFERQDEWGPSPNAQALFERYAEELGLNVEQFSACLSEQRYAEEVIKDLQDGVKYGVRGTPAFFINGRKLEGAHPFERFKALIDAALEQAQQAQQAEAEERP